MVADARTQHLGGFAQAFVAIGHVLHALEDVEPVNDGMGGPLVGRDGDALQHARLGFAVTRQRFDGGEFAHIEVFARAPGAPDIAFDIAFDEGDQASFHGGAHLIAERKSGVHAGGFVCGGQQVGRQCVAACVGVAALWRKVVGQAVAVQVARNLRSHGLPEFAVTQAHRFAGFLFQAGKRVIGKPVFHAGQAFGQLRLQSHAQAAQTRQCVSRGGHVQREWAVQLHQSGLLHGQGHGRDDALAGLEGIACAADRVFGFNFPHDGFIARAGQLCGRGDPPGHFACIARWNVHSLGGQIEQGGARRDHHFHGLLGGVAQRQLGAVLVAFAHQGRQATDDLQVLCGSDAGTARAKQACRGIGHGHDLEGGERIIEGHRDAGLAVGIELDGRLPQQQGVQQLTGAAAPATAAGRHGLATVVSAANDLHLCGGGVHTPGAALHHGFEQVPAAVGHEFKQGLVDCSQGDFCVGCGLSVGQFDLHGDLRLAAHGVALFVGLDADLQLMGLCADLDFGHAQPVGRFAQVHQGCRGNVFAPFVPERGPPFTGRLEAPGEEGVPGHLSQAPAQGQDADVHIGSPAFLDFELNRRVLAIELHHFGVDHAFALDRHQGGGKAERHAHLKLGDVARLVTLFLRQQVHAVMVFATEPEFALACDVNTGCGLDAVAAAVFGGHHQLDLASLIDGGVAQQQAARVAFAAADAAQLFEGGLVVVGVEATNHAFARCGGDACGGFDVEGHAFLRFTRQIQGQGLELHLLAR